MKWSQFGPNFATTTCNNTTMNLERLHKLFRYEPETGRLVRLQTGREITGPYRRKGLKAPYATVRIDGRVYVASRVIWALAKDEWPPDNLIVDHKNGDTHDTRLKNLRLITRGENIENNKTLQFLFRLTEELF